MARVSSLVAVLLALSLCASTADYGVAYSDEIEAFGTDTVNTLFVGAASHAGRHHRGTADDGDQESAEKQLVPAQDGFENSRTRDFLNELVNTSAADKPQQLSNLAFVKTHKTGSTTLSILLYRYGKRHNLEVAHYPDEHPLRIAKAVPKILEESSHGVDIMHYHIGPTYKLGCTWKEAESLYRQVMRDPKSINFVSLLREPRDHIMSFYSYFLERKTNTSIVEFLLDTSDRDKKLLRRMKNPLAGELGLQTEDDVRHFVDDVIPSFQLVLLTERFDEGLMVLRRLMGWHMIDVTYITLNKTAGGSKHGITFNDRPSFDDLPVAVQKKIDKLTALDRLLYDAGKAAFEKRLRPLSLEVAADLTEFNKLQRVVQKYLESDESSLANKMYRLSGLYHDQPRTALPF